MKKISLKNVKGTLSRKEMRSIAGGYIMCISGVLDGIHNNFHFCLFCSAKRCHP